MIDNTKIQFSEEELTLMQMEEWILTKNRIIDKIGTGFHQLADRIRLEVPELYPAISKEICSLGFKVSRGEKYKGLPYLMLDFPRIFGKEEILAIRVLFWWGNFFSVTLHTKGEYARRIGSFLLSGKASVDKDVYISCRGDEWNHDIYKGDYTKLNKMSNKTLMTLLNESAFIKLSKRLDLGQWELSEKHLHTQIHEYLSCWNSAS